MNEEGRGFYSALGWLAGVFIIFVIALVAAVWSLVLMIESFARVELICFLSNSFIVGYIVKIFIKSRKDD